MSWEIDARLINGCPRVEVFDTTSGSVRMAWTYEKPLHEDALSPAEVALKNLLKEMMLLSLSSSLITSKLER